MFDNGINIQSHPTITLYEKKGKKDILLQRYVEQVYSLIASALRENTVEFIDNLGEVNQTFNLQESLLRSAIVPFPSIVDGGQGSTTYSQISGELRNVVIPFTTINGGQTLTTYSQVNGALVIVLKNLGTFDGGTVNQTYSLVSSSLT